MNDKATKRNSFNNRTIIRGKLTLKSDMSIGDGWVEATENDTSTDVAKVALDGNKNPIIPGSAVKGVLRHYLKDCEADPNLVEQVFGKSAAAKTVWNQELSEKEMGFGGRVDFLNSTATTSIVLRTIDYAGIDRVTRTTADGVLYSSRAVPAGTTFDVCIIGYDLDEQHLGMLLAALDGFNRTTSPLRLGSSHANFGGTAVWKSDAITRVDVSALKSWWNAQPSTPVNTWRKSFIHDDGSTLLKTCQTAFPDSSLKTPPCLTLKVTLQFDGPFLVNDSRFEAKKIESDEAAQKDATTKPDKAPDLRPRKTADGRVVLPASSIRGAFRSQAERICSTIGKPCLDPRNLKAKAGEAPDFAVLFGLAGQRAAIQFTDFVSPKPHTPVTRTFVAIDRFTGGSAKGSEDSKSGKRSGKLYTIEYAQEPMLSGHIQIDLQKVTPAALGLLALVFRDLIEGDITFGMGASKGFGSCRATVTLEAAHGIGGVLGDHRFSVIPETLRQLTTVDQFRNPDNYKPLIQACVAAFRNLPGSQPAAAAPAVAERGIHR